MKNLVITVRRGMALSGKITIEGRPQAAAERDIARIRPSLVREPEVLGMPTSIPGAWTGNPAASQPNGVPGSDGLFTLKGVTDGDYRLALLPMPPNSYLKSIRMGALDVLRDGLHIKGQTQDKIEIVIATDMSSISGVVRDGTTRPAPNSTVALVPDGQEFRRRFDLYRSAISDAKGQFQLTNVPPGTYRIFAWNYAVPDAWQNPEFMRPYDGFGKLVQVGIGGGQNIALDGIELLK